MDTIELNRFIDVHNQNLYAFVPFHGIPLRKTCEDLKLVTPDTITRACTDRPMLDQKKYPASQVEGLQKCFVLYVKMPKSRWKDIERAEANTSEGNQIFDELKQECLEKYVTAFGSTKDEKLNHSADLEYGMEMPAS